MATEQHVNGKFAFYYYFHVISLPVHNLQYIISVVLAVGGCIFVDADAVQIIAEQNDDFIAKENCNYLSVFSSSKRKTSDQNAGNS